MTGGRISRVLLVTLQCGVIILLGFYVALHTLIHEKISRQSTNTVNCSSCHSPLQNKRILAWTTFWHEQSFGWEKVFFRLISKQCPVSACEIVYDQRHLNTSDAVLFHPIDMHPYYKFPTYRIPDQQWIFFSLEAPPAIISDQHVTLNGMENKFNWTMSYRRDADIHVPYGRILPIRSNGNQDINIEANERNYWKEKSEDKIAAWMVSHCATNSRREWMVKELIGHMNVDIFGKCGNRKCGKNISFRTLGTYDQDECNDEIKQYYFYFAFENSICTDYVTEKFFLALQLDVVPVVFGGADYANIAPLNSYVHALEFSTPKSLAEFLNIVSKDEKLYNKFFEWKKHYQLELGHPFLPMICDLCAKLHNKPLEHQRANLPTVAQAAGIQTAFVVKNEKTNSYPDIYSWFVIGSACRHWWKSPQYNYLPL